MGVYGLTRHCNNNKSDVSIEMKLHRTSIAIDLDAFIHYCCEQVLWSRARTQHLPTWTLMIGDAREIDLWVASFVRAFQNASIELVAVQDPPSSLSNTEDLKSTTSDKRLAQKLRRFDAMQDKMEDMMHRHSRDQSCSSSFEIPLKEIDDAIGVFPLARLVIHKTLRRLGVPITTAPGEAEQLIAKMIRAGDVEYVLSKDSDCYIMKGSRYIPFQELRLRHDIAQTKVIARVFSPEFVANNLGIEVERLPDLAILCGNDFSDDLFTKHGLASHIVPSIGELMVMAADNDGSYDKGYSRMSMDNAVSWIGQNKSNLLDMVSETAFPEVYTIVKSVYQFYGFLNDEYTVAVEEPLSIMVDIMTAKQYPKKLMAFKLNKVLSGSRGLELELCHSSIISGKGWKNTNDDDDADDVIVLSQPLPTVDDLLADLRKLFGFILFGLKSSGYVFETLRVKNGKQGSSITRQEEVCNFKHSMLHADFQKKLASQLHKILESDLPINVEDLDLDLEKMEIVFTKLMAWYCFPKQLHEKSSKAIKFASSSIVCIEDRLTCLTITSLSNALIAFNKRVIHDCDIARFGWKDIDALLLASILSSNTSNIASKDHLKFLRNYSSAQINIIVLSNWYSRLLDGMMTTRHLLGLHSTTPSASSMFSGTLFSLVATLLSISYAVNRDGDRDGRVLEVLLQIVDAPEVAKAAWKRYRDGRTLLSKMLMDSSIPSSGFVIASNVDNFPKELSMTFSATSVADKLKKNKIASWKRELEARHGKKKESEENISTKSEDVAPLVKDATDDTKSKVAVTPRGMKNSKIKSKSPLAVSTMVKKGMLLVPGSIYKKCGQHSGITKRCKEEELMATKEVQAPKRKKDVAVAHVDLPIYNHTESIVDSFRTKRVTIIVGETGCGKSTSVPMILLDHFYKENELNMETGKVFVTQPRRLAATSLATQVSKLRKETLGGKIGYCIGQEKKSCKDTKVFFVTTGYLLELLSNDPDELSSIKFLILDEIHERSVDADLLLLIIRLQMSRFPDLRLVIMSATMDGGLYKKYFQKSFRPFGDDGEVIPKVPKSDINQLFVGAKLFDVEEIFLDEINFGPQKFEYASSILQMISKEGPEPELNIVSSQLRIALAVLELILVEARDSPNDYESVLVFLPGIAAIDALFSTLSTEKPWDKLVRLFVLHSELEIEEQNKALLPLSADEIEAGLLKVVLSTNIAESSITIPDVTYIINTGLEKQIRCLPESSAEVLVQCWCSKASVKQRKGRAGRVRSGKAFHLFSRGLHDYILPAYATPEILRKPLDKVVLILKATMSSFGIPSQLLNCALVLPDVTNFDAAVNNLFKEGALTDADEQSDVTRFGLLALRLPVNLPITKIIMLGISMGIVNDAVVLAALLSIQGMELFKHPSRYRLTASGNSSPGAFITEMEACMNARIKLSEADDSWSDPLAMLNFYREYLKQPHSSKQRQMKDEFYISYRRFSTFNQAIIDISRRILRMLTSPKIFDQDNMTSSSSPFTVADSLRHLIDAAMDKRTNYHQEVMTANTEQLRFLLAISGIDNIMARKISKTSSAIVGADDGVDSCTLNVLEKGKVPADAIKELLHAYSMNKPDSFDVTKLKSSSNEYTLKTVLDENTEIKSSEVFPFRFYANPVSMLYYCKEGRYPLVLSKEVETVEEQNDGTPPVISKTIGTIATISKLQNLTTGAFSLAAAGGSTTRVNLNSRSVLSLPFKQLATSPSEEVNRRLLWAVCHEKLYQNNMENARGYHWTLLPTDRYPMYVPMLYLITMNADNSLLWVNYDSTLQLIRAFKFQDYSISLETPFSVENMELVNDLRRYIHNSIYGMSVTATIKWNDILTILSPENIDEEDLAEANYEWKSFPWEHESDSLSVFDVEYFKL